MGSRGRHRGGRRATRRGRGRKRSQAGGHSLKEFLCTHHAGTKRRVCVCFLCRQHVFYSVEDFGHRRHTTCMFSIRPACVCVCDVTAVQCSGGWGASFCCDVARRRRKLGHDTAQLLWYYWLTSVSLAHGRRCPVKPHRVPR